MPDSKPVAPLPRDHDQVSFSELMPFRSKKINLWRSPIFYFVAITAIFNVVLFQARVGVISSDDKMSQVHTFSLIVQVSIFYMLALSLLLIHSYAKSDKPIFYYLFPCVFVVLFLGSPLWPPYAIPFDYLGGGAEVMEHSDSFPVRLWAAITAPGLREELLKAMPALICAAITVRPAYASFLPRRIYNLMRLRSPLDGVLMGMASGCAFLFHETSGQYVGGVLMDYYKASGGNLPGAFGSALMLLLPRVMNGWVGHIAWAGIFGYFIGLAVVRPRQGWKLLLVGWLTAAVLHGLWDSSPPGGNLALYVIGGAGGLLAIACLVKARQLDVSLFGRRNESFGSIVVSTPAAAGTPVRPAAMPSPPPRPAPSAQRTPVATAAGSFVLDIAGLRMPLENGSLLDLGAQPALGGRGVGIKAVVTSHPTNPNVLGLKNLGETSWYARLRDDSVQPVGAQRSLRLAPGMTIDFGAGVLGHVAAG